MFWCWTSFRFRLCVPAGFWVGFSERSSSSWTASWCASSGAPGALAGSSPRREWAGANPYKHTRRQSWKLRRVEMILLGFFLCPRLALSNGRVSSVVKAFDYWPENCEFESQCYQVSTAGLLNEVFNPQLLSYIKKQKRFG